MCTNIYDTTYDETNINDNDDEDSYVDEDETGYDFSSVAGPYLSATEPVEVETIVTETTTMSSEQVETIATVTTQTASSIKDVTEDMGALKVSNVVTQYDDGTVELSEEPITATFDATPVKTQPEVNGVAYPCVWLQAKSMPGYVAQALQALLTGGVYNDDVNIYPVYAEVQDVDTTLQLGYIDSKALRNLLSKELFAMFEKRIRLDSDSRHDIIGDMMYAMCTCCTVQ